MQLISTRKTSGRSYQVWATLNMPEHTQLKATSAKVSFEKKINNKTIYLYWWIMLYGWYEVDICVYMVFELLVILMIKESSNLIGVKLTEGLILVWWWWMMMNCFCNDQRKAFSLISTRDHCQISSPSRITDTPRAGFEPAQNLSSGLVEWSCAVVITSTTWRHV